MKYFVPEDSFGLKKDKNSYSLIKESKIKKFDFNGPLFAVEKGKKDTKLLFGNKAQNSIVIDSDYYERGLDSYFSTSISKKMLLNNAPSFIIITDTNKLYDEQLQTLAASGYNVLNFDFQNPQTSNKFSPLKDIYQQKEIFINEEKLTKAACSEKLSFFTKNFIKALFSWDERDPFDYMTIELLEGYLLGMLEDGAKQSEFTLQNFYKKIYQKDIESETTYESIKKYFLDKSEFVYIKAKNFLDSPLKTKAPVYKTMLQKLNYLKDKKLNDFFAHDELDIDKFVTYPTAIFIKHNTNQASPYSHFCNLLIDQITRKLLEKAKTTQNFSLPKHIDFFVENVLTLGKINIMPYLLTLGRSRNISTTLLASSYDDIKLVYQDETDIIIGNCTNTMLFACNDKDTIDNICQVSFVQNNKKYPRGKILAHNSKVPYTEKKMQKVDFDAIAEDEYLLRVFSKSLLKSKWNIAGVDE